MLLLEVAESTSALNGVSAALKVVSTPTLIADVAILLPSIPPHEANFPPR